MKMVFFQPRKTRNIKEIYFRAFRGKKTNLTPFTVYSSSAATTANFVRSFSSLFLGLPAIAEDYPEIIIPLKAKTDTNKQRRVVYQDKTVRIHWASCERGQYWFRFPDIPENSSCFAHVMSQSIGSKIRGPFYVAPDGVVIRPDLVVLDDIQDPAIAKNPDRIDELWGKITKDIAGMSGTDPMPIINSGTPFHTECLNGKNDEGLSFQRCNLSVDLSVFETNGFMGRIS